MFVGIYHISNLITYLGMGSSLLGITLALNGRVNLAIIALVVSGICDLFDGIFARRFNRTTEEKAFGVQLDSLADVLSFGALPAVLLYQLGLSRWYHICLLIFYIFALVTRLAYFNLSVENTDTSVPVSYYYGMPVTYSALLFSVIFLLSYFLSPDIFRIILTSVTLLITLLFILKIKIPKPRGLSYLFFGLLAIGTIVAVLLLGGI